VFICFFTGIVGYVNALAAQYHGAGRPERTVEAVSQGFWLSLASVPLLFLLIRL
jgi:MATE family multidrug resistance protein